MQAVLHKQQEMLGPDNLQVEQTFGRLGGLWLKAGDPLSAIASLKEALRISILQSDGKPTSAVAICRLNLGVMYANAHRYDEALDEWRAADRAYSLHQEGTEIWKLRVAGANGLPSGLDVV